MTRLGSVPHSDAPPPPYPHRYLRWIGGDELPILALSPEEHWRVRDVVRDREGWRPAEPFKDLWVRPRLRVFTRCDGEGRPVRPVERRATEVGSGPGEFDFDLSTLLAQLERAETWNPEEG